MLLRFPGQWEDGVGGFYQNWWREYMAGVGLYSQSDRIGILGGFNIYSYVQGDPVRSIDYTGLAPGDLFSSPVAAGVDALLYIFATYPDARYREYCGLIYAEKRGGAVCYIYHSIERGTSVFEETTPGVLASCGIKKSLYNPTTVGVFHNHPEIGTVRHSPADFFAACGNSPNGPMVSVVGIVKEGLFEYSVYDARLDPGCINVNSDERSTDRVYPGLFCPTPKDNACRTGVYW